MTRFTLTERDVLAANASSVNVSTYSSNEQLAIWKRKAWQQQATQAQGEYLMSARSIRTSSQPVEPKVSPAWLGRVKSRLRALVNLPIDWDTYGGTPADPRLVGLAEDLVEWFAVDGVPPPDVFATGDGGVQLEWHIRDIDVTITFPPSDEAAIFHHDLAERSEPWSAPLSDRRLQVIRRRLLQNP